METCEVTFHETAPCPSLVFEPACPNQMGHTIFVEDEHDNTDWGDPEPTPPASLGEPPSSTLVDGPNPSPSTTWGPLELTPAETRGVEADVEGKPRLRGRLHDMFGTITLLNRLVRLIYKSVTPCISRCLILLTQLLLLLLSPRYWTCFV
jgi:hypothetical protein